MRSTLLARMIGLSFFAIILGAAPADQEGANWTPLFQQKGLPQGWLVREWDDLTKPAPTDANWTVDADGILHGSDPRGTWLLSEKEYGDFELELEFKLPPRGNSGVALRAPMHGDPAYDGMELQIVDPRYYDGKGRVDQLTGSLYRAVAPKVQVFRPEQWNHYHITCRGSHVTVVLNGQQIQDVDLDTQTKDVDRDNDQKAIPLKDRPRRGHIGFQELSRGGHVQIRNVRLRELQ